MLRHLRAISSYDKDVFVGGLYGVYGVHIEYI